MASAGISAVTPVGSSPSSSTNVLPFARNVTARSSTRRLTRRKLLVRHATTSQRAVFRDCLGQQRIEYFVTFDIANILLESGAAINRHGNLLVAFLLYPNRASSQHRTATFEPLSQHHRETLTVMTSVTERCLVELSTLEIEVNVGFPGEADTAMYL